MADGPHHDDATARPLKRKLKALRDLASVIGWGAALKLAYAHATKGPPRQVTVKKSGRVFTIRPADSDANVLRTVYAMSEMKLPEHIKPRTILDGGANVGLSAAWFLDNYPGVIVVGVEPNSKNCELLKQNAKTPDNRLKILKAGLWTKTGHCRIANPDDQSWAFRIEEATADDPSAIPCVTIDGAAQWAGIDAFDVVKLDIEGAEMPIFEAGIDAWAPRTKCVIIEAHGTNIAAVVRRELLKHGFTLSEQGEKIVGWRG